MYSRGWPRDGASNAIPLCRSITGLRKEQLSCKQRQVKHESRVRCGTLLRLYVIACVCVCVWVQNIISHVLSTSLCHYFSSSFGSPLSLRRLFSYRHLSPPLSWRVTSVCGLFEVESRHKASVNWLYTGWLLKTCYRWIQKPTTGTLWSAEVNASSHLTVCTLLSLCQYHYYHQSLKVSNHPPLPEASHKKPSFFFFGIRPTTWLLPKNLPHVRFLFYLALVWFQSVCGVYMWVTNI